MSRCPTCGRPTHPAPCYPELRAGDLGRLRDLARRLADCLDGLGASDEFGAPDLDRCISSIRARPDLVAEARAAGLLEPMADGRPTVRDVLIAKALGTTSVPPEHQQLVDDALADIEQRRKLTPDELADSLLDSFLPEPAVSLMDTAVAAETVAFVPEDLYADWPTYVAGIEKPWSEADAKRDMRHQAKVGYFLSHDALAERWGWPVVRVRRLSASAAWRA